MGDIALKHAALGYRDADIAGCLENIVFLELKRRGYEVFVGKQGEAEIDFVARRRDNTIYVQVAYLLASQETIDREFKPLLLIDDNYPKYVVTLDKTWTGNYKGIIHKHLTDFLLAEDL